jgi:hypothetical protein
MRVCVRVYVCVCIQTMFYFHVKFLYREIVLNRLKYWSYKISMNIWSQNKNKPQAKSHKHLSLVLKLRHLLHSPLFCITHLLRFPAFILSSLLSIFHSMHAVFLRYTNLRFTNLNCNIFQTVLTLTLFALPAILSNVLCLLLWHARFMREWAEKQMDAYESGSSAGWFFWNLKATPLLLLLDIVQLCACDLF